LDAIAQRLFAVDVLAAIHRPIGDKGMGVIQAAADDGLDIFLIQALAPIEIVFGIRKFPGSEREMFLVDVAQGDDVFGGEAWKMGLTPAPGSNQGHIQLVTRRVSAEQSCAGKNETRGSGESNGFEESDAFHRRNVKR